MNGRASELEQQIYEAAIIPEKWGTVLANLAGAAGSFGAVLLSARHTGEVRSVASPQAQPMWHEWLAGGWHLKSQRPQRLLASNRSGWVRDLDIFNRSEIETLPEYVDFLAPRGLKWGAAAAIPMPNGDRAILSMERLAVQGPFDLETVAGLDGLYGHLARASMIAGLLCLERERNAVDTLAAIGLPAAALAIDGTITVANGMFEQERGLWFTRGQDRLSLHDRRAQKLLAESIDQSKSAMAGRSIPLQSSGGEDRAVLHVLPVRRSANDIFSRSAVIGVLTKASARPAVAPPLLKALFDLAPAEASVASDLAAGMTVEAIALRRGSTIETIRTHLKNIRMKTGCRRQAELVALLAQLVPFPAARSQ